MYMYMISTLYIYSVHAHVHELHIMRYIHVCIHYTV